MNTRLFFPALSFLILSSCGALKNSIRFADNPVVAHRGAWKALNLPENSIASLKQAILIGCHGSEFDVRMTADDSLIVNHDPHYNKLLVEKSTYADLEKFKLHNGEKLPTLREYVLAGIKNNRHTQLVCEIKPSDMGKERAEQIVKKVLATFKELKAEKYVTYISFDYHMLKTIQQLNPSATTQYLNGNKSPELLKADKLTGLDYHFDAFKKNKNWIREAKEQGLTLNVWTVDDPQLMDHYLTNKFNYITTNEPEILLERYKKSSQTQKFSKLIWSDEFNSHSLDTTKWNYDLGNGNQGWGNNEKQYYTSRPENIKIENGILKITAKKENYSSFDYTSAKVTTKKKLEFTYGKVEVRAKLPSGGGTWPAIWMLGANIEKVGWPACGEIDIMENIGNDLHKILSTIHYPQHSAGKGISNTVLVKDVATEFHIYSLEWTADYLKMYVDNQLIGFYANSNEIPFNHDFFLILNLAIGGNLGGDIDPKFKNSSFEIDYVKVYQ